MALGADIDMELRDRGARLERVTTAAGYRSLVILRMDTLFHSLFHLAFPQTGIRYKPALRKLGLDLASRFGE